MPPKKRRATGMRMGRAGTSTDASATCLAWQGVWQVSRALVIHWLLRFVGGRLAPIEAASRPPIVRLRRTMPFANHIKQRVKRLMMESVRDR